VFAAWLAAARDADGFTLAAVTDASELGGFANELAVFAAGWPVHAAVNQVTCERAAGHDQANRRCSKGTANISHDAIPFLTVVR
jgi:hypothetical protein